MTLAQSATTEVNPGGVRLIVVSKRPDDTKLLARIRALGFAGLITECAHHQPHHLATVLIESLRCHVTGAPRPSKKDVLVDL